MPLRPGLQWTGQNLSPALPSPEGKSDTGSLKSLNCGRGVGWPKCQRLAVRSNAAPLIKLPEACQYLKMPRNAFFAMAVDATILGAVIGYYSAPGIFAGLSR